MATRETDTLEQVIVAELPRWIAAHPTLRAQLWDALTGAVPDAPLRMTYEQFLAWADEDTLAEWVAVPDTDEGEVVVTSPASNKHQDIARFLTALLSIYVETQQLGVVRPAPFQMKLEHSGREPDLLFVATAHLDRLKETHLDGPADLVVEIVSPESIGRDRGTKFVEYARGGVLEYWLLDPQARRAEFYRLREMGQYETAFAGHEGRYEAQILPGFWLRVEWLWQEPLPKTLDMLRELGLLG
jgi:Uma2 family endonuclease